MSIDFQLLDYIEINDKIILFGVDKKGNSLSCQVNNYKPYFYIKQLNQNEIKTKKDKYTVTDVIGKNFFGYKEDNEIFQKITFKNLSTYKRCKYEYKYKIINEKSVKTNEKLFDNDKIKTFEACFSPVLRFLQDRNIICSSWVSVNKYELTEGETRCKICISTEPEQIAGLQCEDIAPITQASLDIECYSSIDGQFPSPDNKGDEVIQIALILKKVGSDITKKYLITQKISNDIDDCILICCKNEKELFDTFSKIFIKEDPDIIYTYNGDWFDFHYLFTRAEKYNYDSFFNISRLPDLPPEIQNTNFTSGAYGSTDYRRLTIPGRINFDLLIYINREFKLRSYKLDDVAEHFLKQNKLPISPKQIFEYYADGDPEKIKQIGKYCIQDTLLLQLLVDKLSILINQMEMSKATYVPIRFLWERGQQIKVYSQIIRKTKEVNYFIPDSKFIPDEEKFQGAVVLEPDTGAYFNPIIVLDFASLYPSIIRAYNLCYSSIILGETKPPKDEEIYKVDVGNNKVYNFVQNKKITVIPKLLEELLQKRIDTKNQMKIETDPFKLIILDKKQSSYKISMNSVYGFFASHMIRCKPIAECTTALGRQMIIFTKDYIETNYTEHGCKIIYGDSVSGNTPILLKNKEGNIIIKTIETLGELWYDYSNFKPGDISRTNKEQTFTSLQVWTDKGWSKINKVIRHKTNKKMYRISTHTGSVDVSEDHSLLDENCNIIKSGKCSLKTKLLQSYPIFDTYNKINFNDLTNYENIKSIELKKMFIYGFFYGDGSCGKYGEKDKVKYSWALNNSDIKICNLLKIYCEDIYKCEFKILQTMESSGVYKIVKTGDQKNNVLLYRSLFYDKDKLKIIPEEILNSSSYENRLAFFKGYYLTDGSKCLNEKTKCIRFDNKGKIGCAGLYYLCKSLGFNCSINNTKRDIYRITCTFEKQRKVSNQIKKIQKLPQTTEYIYDLETEIGRFQAGIGDIIVKNTDSVFVNSNVSDVSSSFELGKKMAQDITKELKYPLKLEFEKSYNPLLLIGKKMYVGKLFSSGCEKHDYIDKKGVVSKRRDNANIVQKLYNQTIEYVMNNDGHTAMKYIKNELLKLISGKFDINDLIITKTLKSNYKNVNVPHNQLAIKMKERDPSTAPKSNDRVRYIFIENEFSRQFEKVEDPDYAIANNLKIDTVYYIIHQLEKPLSQILKLISEENDIFQNVISDYKMKQKKLKVDIQNQKSGQRKITDFFTK